MDVENAVVVDARPLLTLGVGRFEDGLSFTAAHKDVAYGSAISKAVISRSEGRCRYCGDPAGKFLQIHHEDGNHQNNEEENLHPICPLCHAVLHLEESGKNGGGVIVYWPEIEQIYLNRLMRGLICGVLRGAPDAGALSSRVGAGLKKRAAIVENAWGSSSALDFAIAFKELGPYTYNELVEKTVDLRFIPTMKCAFLEKPYLDFLVAESDRLDRDFKNADNLMFGLLGPNNG